MKRTLFKLTLLFFALWAARADSLAQAPDVFGGAVQQAGGLREIPPIDRNVWALDADNTFHVRSACTKQFKRAFELTLFTPGEVLIGIDFRTTDNQLYALSNLGRIYIVDVTPPGRGNVVRIATLNPNFAGGFQSLADFNPLLVQGATPLRLIGSNRMNYAVVGANLNLTVPQQLTTYVAGDMNAAVLPSITGGAYSNNVQGATMTIFYALDYNLHTLVTPLVGANGSSATGAGVFQTIGMLRDARGNALVITPTADLDIYTENNNGLWSNYILGVTGRTLFYVNVADIPAPILGVNQDVTVKIDRLDAGGIVDIAVSTRAIGTGCGRNDQ
ncbi:MAG: DUF4394 domain-containing protein [Acidobacteria bacterium]|nr:DUF4394 domain-containing protein [Acidobacteriota bacterium]